MRKIIIAPDSFKGSLTSTEFCRIAEECICEILPDCQVAKIPVADGGEGTLDAVLSALPEGERITITVSGPYMNPTAASYGLFRRDDDCALTAVIEMAQAAGLPLAQKYAAENLPSGKTDPRLTSTHGVGELISDAIDRGAKHIILGLGGSSTNDAGCGCAAALGAVFYDADGNQFIPAGGTLSDIVRIDTTALRQHLQGISITAMCDITNPMYGEHGAAYVFGPQKGADNNAILKLDEGLRHVAGIFDSLMLSSIGSADNADYASSDSANNILNADIHSISSLPGSGAAGAYGAGVVALMDGRLHSGIDTLLDMCSFDQLLEDADMVITGEGRIDSQSIDGKALSGIAHRVSDHNRSMNEHTRLIAFCGQISDKDTVISQMEFDDIICINPAGEDAAYSMEHAGCNFRRTFTEYLKELI